MKRALRVDQGESNPIRGRGRGRPPLTEEQKAVKAAKQQEQQEQRKAMGLSRRAFCRIQKQQH